MDYVNYRNSQPWLSSPFRHLTAEEFILLADCKVDIVLKRGSTLNQQGHTANCVYFIQSGFAKITWPDVNFQKESIVKIVGPGDMTGYRCIFSEENFRATAVALGPLTGFKIPKNLFIDLLRMNQEFNFDILSLMGTEIRKSELRLHSFCTRNVRERLTECLLQLVEIGGTLNADGSYSIDIKLSRDELGSIIGAAKETVVRALTELKDEKIISQADQTLMILEIEKLKNIANNIY